MPDFTDHLLPASPRGPEILFQERAQSDVPINELAHLLLSRNDFLRRQEKILPLLENHVLFRKVKQPNLSRPERYQLGLARAKTLRRWAVRLGWDEEDWNVAGYLCDDVSP